MLKSFLCNNVRVKLVPYHGQDTHPETGIAFYVNNGNGGVIGVRVYPDERKELCNATCSTCKNSKIAYNAKRKQRYLQFKHAWKTDDHIYASHAVYIAWREKPIPPGMTIDHIDGCTTNNDVRNLRCVSGAINSRDGGFLHKLQHNDIDPTTVQRWMLLRYFDRMVHVKEQLSPKQYRRLTRDDLTRILYDAEI